MKALLLLPALLLGVLEVAATCPDGEDTTSNLEPTAFICKTKPQETWLRLDDEEPRDVKASRQALDRHLDSSRQDIRDKFLDIIESHVARMRPRLRLSGPLGRDYEVLIYNSASESILFNLRRGRSRWRLFRIAAGDRAVFSNADRARICTTRRGCTEMPLVDGLRYKITFDRTTSLWALALTQ